jgi:sugar/nucleoside kinase (ribokinase family)
MRVTVLGGAAWNRMVHLDRLPDGRAATVHPTWHHDAIGGAGAGKALNLARLGVEVTLFAGLGDDEAGARVRAGLVGGGVDVRAATDPSGTPQHVNLMDPAGGRISIMLENGSAELPIDADSIASSLGAADVVVVDLAPWTPRILDLAQASGRPVWTDLHDYDRSSAWYIPFVDAADVVFASGDRLPDPAGFLRSLIAAGKGLAVCTLGIDGAIALDADGRSYEVPALPDVEVVDSNGAGDAFFAGVLFGVLDGAPLERALRFGSLAAAMAVGSSDLASDELDPARVRAGVI